MLEPGYERITGDDVRPEEAEREGTPSKREEGDSFRGGLEKDRLARLPKLVEERISGDEIRSVEADREGYSLIVPRSIPPVASLLPTLDDRSPICGRIPRSEIGRAVSGDSRSATRPDV